MDRAKKIAQELISSYFFKGVNIARDTEGSSGRSHLRWMLHQIDTNQVKDDEAHRWIGFVQGALAAKGLSSFNEMSKLNKRAIREEYA